MNMDFKRKMPTYQTVRDMYPLTEALAARKKANDEELRRVILGESDKLILLIGPCSADREDSVLEYITRLRGV